MKKLLILGALAAGLAFFGNTSTAQADHGRSGGFGYYSPRSYSGFGYSPRSYYGRSGFGFSTRGFSISIGRGGFWGGRSGHRHHYHGGRGHRGHGHGHHRHGGHHRGGGHRHGGGHGHRH